MKRPRMGMLAAAGALALASVAACSPITDNTDFRQRALEQIASHKSAWTTLAIHDYDFSYAKVCDCPSATNGVRIQVRSDQVAKVTDLTAGTDLTANTNMAWPNVDSLFARATAMMNDNTVTVQVVFDTLYAFPSFSQSFKSRTGDVVSHSAISLVPVTAP